MRTRQITAMGKGPLVACAIVASSLATTAVTAADYPVLRGSQIDDAPPAPEFSDGKTNWSGFYVGGGAGVSRTKFNPGATGLQEQYRDLNANLSLNQQYSLPASQNFRIGNDSGANYAAFVGYNFLFGDVVMGLEADYTRLDHHYASFPATVTLIPTSNGPARTAQLTATQTLDDYASARIRLGYVAGRFMPFATFGFAAGRGTTIAGVNPDSTGRAFSVQAKNSYMYGLTAGLGVDAALTDNLFLRAEYLFTRFDSFEGTVVDINNVRLGAGLKF